MEGVRSTVVPSDVVNEDDQGAILTIALALGIMLMMLFLGTRLLIRWPWTQLLGRDDTAVAVATALGTLQAGLTSYGISSGLGSKEIGLAPREDFKVAKLVYAFDLLFVATVYADKCAVVLFFFRLSEAQGAVRACTGLLATAAAFFVASVVTIGLQTPLSSPWSEVIGESRLSRWIAMEALSASLELAIVAFPIYLVGNLQMDNSVKITVIGWFALRLG